MAIKNAVTKDEGQTELQVESREEKLARLLSYETQIHELRIQEEGAKALASGYKSQIKDIESQKEHLVKDLNAGQETLVVKDADEDEEEGEE